MPSLVSLPSKPSAQISYNYIPASSPNSTSPRLVVFLNGMVSDQKGWLPVIESIIQNNKDGNHQQSYGFVTYDRFGQGETVDRDPTDEDQFGHDLEKVVEDLHELLQQIMLSDPALETASHPHLFLVGNSIGCAIARHYAARFPQTVSALLLLDSILANSDFYNDIFPNPDAPDAASASIHLPEGMTLEMLRGARAKSFAIFSPTQPNKEGFDRRNMAQILPSASEPKLVGPPTTDADGNTIEIGPYLTVVGHDPATFAQQSEKMMGIPTAATLQYVQPVWEKYNRDLTTISDREPGKEWKMAEGSGHLVQVQKPGFVVEEIKALLSSLDW